MKNLNIYFSDACNFKCAYCCMQHQEHDNKHIQECFKNGSFTKTILETITPETTSIGLWGMEPSLNGLYFSAMITAILKRWPQIKNIMFSTNGTSELYRYFVMPLLSYDVTLHIQFSIDGPEDMNDFNRQKGAYKNSVRALEHLIYSCPTKMPTNNFQLKLSTKSTLTKINLRTDPAVWYAWAQALHDKMIPLIEKRPYINIDAIGAKPTIEVPGRYFGYDAENYRKWFGTIEVPKQTPHCMAGIDSFTIDCNGKLWDCQMRKNKDGYDEKILRSNFDKRVSQLLKDNQITQTDKDMLFNAIMSVWCWASATDINTIDDSYILLFGNL